MRLFGLLCVTAYCAASWLVGIRLARLTARTGGAPERMIGTALLAGGAFGYPASVVAMLLAAVAPEAALRIGVASTLGLGVASGAMLVAWRVIYHPGAAWSGGIAACGLALLFGTTVDRAADFDPLALVAAREHGLSSGLALSIVTGALPYALNAVSGIRYHALLRRRLALGLADAAVARRVLFWSLTGCVVVVQYAFTLASPLLWRWFDASALSTAVIGSLGLANATFLLLAFFPAPAWLRRAPGRVR